MSSITKGTVIVTGAGSGIGFAIARRLSAEGYPLIIVGRDEKKLKSASQILITPHEIVPVDLNLPEAPEIILEKLSSPKLTPFPLYGLVNNAAIFHRLSFQSTSVAQWREEIETNLMSPVRLIQSCLKKFEDGSVIVNISSTLGLRPIANTSAYSAVKSALNNLTQCLAIELAPKIRVCGVCPGLVDTPIHPFHKESKESANKIAADSAQPMRRMGTPDEIAAMVNFLMSDESLWTTGSLHVVDGGIVL